MFGLLTLGLKAYGGQTDSVSITLQSLKTGDLFFNQEFVLLEK